MKLTRKLLALLLSAVLCLSLVPVIGADGAPESEPMDNAKKIESLLDFSNRINDMAQKFAPETTRADIENPYATARIIVKSANELNYDGALAAVNGHNDLHIIQYATAAEAEKACAMYSKLPGVQYAEPDRIASVTAEPGVDEFLSWGFADDHVAAYNYNEWILDYAGGLNNLPQVVVAVIDTGADSDHPFIMDRLVAGYDFSNNDSNPEDDHYHGTHVSGTVIDGTLDNVVVMPLKALDSGGNGYQSQIALAMEYAYLNGATVVNMSLRGIGYSDLYEETINDGAAVGTVYCVAAGNDRGNADNCCPANVVRAVTVAAIDSNNLMANFSNTGSVVDISAPGVDINSAAMGGGYRLLDGTSMATPHVAAVAAMIKSYDPEMDVDTLTEVLLNSTRPWDYPGGGVGLLCARDMLSFDMAINAEDSYMHFTSDSAYPWTVDGDSAMSGNTGVNSSSSEITSNPTLRAYQTISFTYKVSGDSGDYLAFFVDGQEIMREYGEQDWTVFSYTIPEAGRHELEWRFVKDGSGSSGSDAAWIKDVGKWMTISSIINTGNGNFLFENSEQYPWTVDGESVKSGNAGVNNSVSEVSTFAEVVGGITLTFDYKVSSGAGDKFQFIVNGQVVLESNSQANWAEYEYTFPQDGTYDIVFRYVKDGSGASGDDAAWVRNVDLTYTLNSVLNVHGGRLAFESSGNYAWEALSDCAKSTNEQMPNTESVVSVVVNMQAGDTLSFRYRVSSEANYDKLFFRVNGTEMFSYSGNIGWTEYVYTAASTGSYTFRWSYSKDGSVNTGEDAAYLADVALSTSVIPGDCDGDGVVSVADGLIAMRYAMGIIDENDLIVSAADIDGDGNVLIADAITITRIGMGLN